MNDEQAIKQLRKAAQAARRRKNWPRVHRFRMAADALADPNWGAWIDGGGMGKDSARHLAASLAQGGRRD